MGDSFRQVGLEKRNFQSWSAPDQHALVINMTTWQWAYVMKYLKESGKNLEFARLLFGSFSFEHDGLENRLELAKTDQPSECDGHCRHIPYFFHKGRGASALDTYRKWDDYESEVLDHYVKYQSSVEEVFGKCRNPNCSSPKSHNVGYSGAIQPNDFAFWCRACNDTQTVRVPLLRPTACTYVGKFGPLPVLKTGLLNHKYTLVDAKVKILQTETSPTRSGRDWVQVEVVSGMLDNEHASGTPWNIDQTWDEKQFYIEQQELEKARKQN